MTKLKFNNKKHIIKIVILNKNDYFEELLNIIY